MSDEFDQLRRARSLAPHADNDQGGSDESDRDPAPPDIELDIWVATVLAIFDGAELTCGPPASDAIVWDFRGAGQ